MFGLKKKGRERAKSFQDAVKAQFLPIMSRFGERIRFRQRVRLANSWAKKHPKRLMINYSAFAVLLLGLTLLTDFSRKTATQEDILGLESIPQMTHRLQSLNNTEIKNERIRQEINALGMKGMVIYNELDSLMKLPVKTHADSVRIFNNYNILNKTFNAHGHEL